MKELKRLRIERGLTQEALAARIGVARPAVARWETGVRKPQLSTLARIAEALDIDPRELWAIAARDVATGGGGEGSMAQRAECSDA